MHIAHVVASIDDEAAGPSVSVPRLAQAQAEAGEKTELATVATGKPPGRDLAPSVPQRRYRHSFAGIPLARKLFASEDLRRDLLARSERIDVVHSHGLWLMPNVYPAAMTRLGTHFVLSPRGMLGADALAFSRSKKRAFHTLFQKHALAHAALLHATSQSEVNDIRDFGLDTPVVVAPNGVDIPANHALTSAIPPRTVLSLGRVHPKKGLDRLVRAFAQLEPAFPEWRLRIIGPSEIGYANQLKCLAGELGCRSISIEGPLFGEEKLATYRQAAFFVLPTLNENFAMTVAEALAAGIPVISTKGAPWEGLETERCGLWVDHGPDAMVVGLCKLMELSDTERAQMGERGRAWMARDFSWGSTARILIDAYAWLVGGDEAPAEVQFVDA